VLYSEVYNVSYDVSCVGIGRNIVGIGSVVEIAQLMSESEMSLSDSEGQVAIFTKVLPK
jgi:hypothetical protein